MRLNQKDTKKTIDLFLRSKDERSHYYLIKNFSRLTRSQITSHSSSRLHICKKCLTHFTKPDLFKKHSRYCSQNETVAVKMPRNRVIKQNKSLLTRKGVYAYDYVSSIDKLKETKLPSKEDFYSKLNDEEISEDYQHAINVWNTFNCQTLQDYHDLYLKSDVLLLADVFEIFRKTCLKHYKLDPCHYYTAPGLAWDACLKETNQNLELLKDYDMLMMFEQGIGGGISHISKRYAEANNKYMKNYDKSKPSTYIQYLDANNLYGWAMSQKLPTHGFKWIDVNKTKVMKLLEKRFHIRG